MTTSIARLYETEQQAREAVGKLQEAGFTDDMVFLVTPVAEAAMPEVTTAAKAGAGGKKDTEADRAVSPVPPSAGEPMHASSAAVMSGYLLGDRAKLYAGALRRGRSLVVTRAPFGYAQQATDLMDSCGPVETDLGRPATQETYMTWDPAAPVSSAFGVPVLRRNRPTPFSDLLGLPAVSRGGMPSTFSRAFGDLIDPDFALFGRSRLLRDPAPLSSLLGLRTVSEKSGGPSWTKSLGLPLLSANPAPFSSIFGLPLHTEPFDRKHPAPFSAVLGLPTISHRRSLLSRLFGELVSPDYALFGRNPLIRNPAPLSSALGVKTVSTKEGGAAWTRSFGLPLLSADPAPFSSTLGLPVHTERLDRNHPAPLSAVLGLPTISHGPSYLSRVFGELVSSDFGLFGRNPLISNPAPFSSLVGLKTLSGKTGAAWRSSFGLPLLAGTSPVSSKLGIPELVGQH